MIWGATGCRRTSGRSACSMAAISPDSQSRLPASLRQIWCCRSGRIACLVPCWRTAEDNSLPVRLFRAYPRKNPGRCDPLHISLVGTGLDRRHEQRDANLIRRAGRPPHRLRPDRYRRRGGSCCAGLPPAGLNRAESSQRAFIRALSGTSARQSNRFTASGFFHGTVAAASWPPGSAKIRQARRVLRLLIIHHFH